MVQVYILRPQPSRRVLLGWRCDLADMQGNVRMSAWGLTAESAKHNAARRYADYLRA